MHLLCRSFRASKILNIQANNTFSVPEKHLYQFEAQQLLKKCCNFKRY
ncbi:hypothetical protein HMPREF9144_2644 [Prevotella pallens ATCC 700821]|uniref:Uncharacterized protein n=1 Tax=Prevotella pallens ATCC 700821 TaxID=997353 RepID=F9DLV2_9BACT|nr:hypothetical protein HMPREF9144_2644 [Prevotella pallens ATCC 700821]